MSQDATITALRPGPRTRTLTELYRTIADNGLCADQVDDDIYFADYPTAEQAEQACAGCPVRAQCLEMALRTRAEHGIWGGTTPGQRAEILALEQAVAS